MSYKSIYYSKYATYFREIFAEKDFWDRQIHMHTTEEILLLTQPGACTVVNNGSTLTVPTPAFIWNRAGSFHCVQDVSYQTDSYVFSFQPQILSEMPKQMQKFDFVADSTLFALPLDWKQTSRMHALFNAAISSPFFQRPLLLSCIFHQVTQGLAAGLTPIQVNSIHGYIFEVIKLLQSPSPEKLTTEVLAARFHVGQTKLKADFKKLTNMPIHTFRLRQQLHTARAQIAATKAPLVQIAHECGFTDESHLIRAFRAEYGITPGVFRKKYMGDFRKAEHVTNYRPV